MTPDDRWLAAVWPFVRGQLPSPCLRPCWRSAAGRWAVCLVLLGRGLPGRRRRPGSSRKGPTTGVAEFEGYAPPWPVESVVASSRCTTWPTWTRSWTGWECAAAPAGRWWWWSGHGKGSTSPRPDGARPSGSTPTPGNEPGWLAQAPGAVDTGQPWDAYLRSWAEQEACTPAPASCGDWMRASPATSMPWAPTISLTWPTPPRRRSRPRSTPA